MNKITMGLLAGAVGTMALDVATYCDMTVRGRGPSSVPANVIRELARAIGVSACSRRQLGF